MKDANGKWMPKNYSQHHIQECGKQYRGCAPHCPVQIYEDTEIWTGPSKQEYVQKLKSVIDEYNKQINEILNEELPMNSQVTKFDYIFDVGFSVKSNNAIDDLTPEEIIYAMEERVRYLRQNPSEVFEAVGVPTSTIVNDRPKPPPTFLTIYPHPLGKSFWAPMGGPCPYLNFGPRDIKVGGKIISPMLQKLSECELERETELQNFVIFVPEQILEVCPYILEDLVKKNFVIIVGDTPPSYLSGEFGEVAQNSAIVKDQFYVKRLFLYPSLEEVFIKLN